jgi:sodium transport system permease protein
VTNAWLALARKEWLESMRDGRTLLSSMSYALAGPVVLLIVVVAIARARDDGVAYEVSWCEPGARVEALEGYLEAERLRIVDESPVCLDVRSDFTSRLQRGGSARIAVVGPLGAHAALVGRVESATDRFSHMLVARRLLDRGVAPAVTEAITMDRRDTGALSRDTLWILGMLVPVLLAAPLFASMATTIDSTAGERERHSMETLLAQPVTPVEIVLAKWLVSAALAAVGIVVTVAATLWLLPRSPLLNLGVHLAAGVATGVAICVALLPLAASGAALQLAIAVSARSYKEGQAWLTLLSLAPMILGVLASVRELPAMSAPWAWELTQLRYTLATGTLDLAAWAWAAAGHVAICTGALAIAVRRMSAERFLQVA